jgi:hypothetical protein
VGLYIRGGWEFVLVLHALVRLDAVVVLLDPFGDSTVPAARGASMDFLLSHRSEDDLLEDAVVAYAGDVDPPTYSVAEDFTLVVLADRAEAALSGGFVFLDVDEHVIGWTEFAEHLVTIGRALDLQAGTQVLICGHTVSAEVVSVILASARAGSCLHLTSNPPDVDSWVGVDGDMVSVVVAPGSTACAVLDSAPIAVRDGLRLAVDKRQGLSEAVLRRYGMVRKIAASTTIYESVRAHDSRGVESPRDGAGLRSVS